MTYDAIVIGAGVNGLTTAALLAKRGRRVVVVEQRDQAGGVCTTEEFYPGYRANMCVDDPGWMPERVVRALGLHAYAATPSTTGAVFPTSSGSAPVILYRDPQRAAASIAGHSPADAAKWVAFCQQVHDLSGMLASLYDKPAPIVGSTAVGDLLGLASTALKLKRLGKRGMVDFLRAVPMEVTDYLDEWFESEALRGALSLGGVRDVQHGPMSGGTTLVLLHQHVGMPLGLLNGRRIPIGGVGALPNAVLAAAQTAGAEFKFGAEVIQIVTKADRATGVVLVTGETLEAKAVISSADVRRTFGTLVDPGVFDPEFLGQTDAVRMRSPSVRVHLALDGLPEFPGWSSEALGGTITIAPTVSYVERAYDAAKHGGMAEEPAVQVTIPTLADPSLAPSGQHVMTIHAQYAAHRLEGGWTALAREHAAKAAVQAVEQVAPTVGSHVRHMTVLAPPDVERAYFATEGSVQHGELALDQFLFMRPVPACARHTTPLPGLYLCGSSTHPGAGTAGASGYLAARALLAEER